MWEREWKKQGGREGEREGHIWLTRRPLSMYVCPFLNYSFLDLTAPTLDSGHNANKTNACSLSRLWNRIEHSTVRANSPLSLSLSPFLSLLSFGRGLLRQSLKSSPISKSNFCPFFPSPSFFLLHKYIFPKLKHVRRLPKIVTKNCSSRNDREWSPASLERCRFCVV